MASVKQKNFFKSALPAQDFFLGDTEDTCLALPLEGNIATSLNHTIERSSRVQQQVLLTLARKGKRTTSNGSLYSAKNQPETEGSSATDSAGGILYGKCSSLGHMNGDIFRRERCSGRFSWREGGTRTTGRVEVSPHSSSLYSRPCLGNLRYGVSRGGAYTLPVRSPSTTRNSRMLRSQASALCQTQARAQMARSMKLGEAPKRPKAPVNPPQNGPATPLQNGPAGLTLNSPPDAQPTTELSPSDDSVFYPTSRLITASRQETLRSSQAGEQQQQSRVTQHSDMYSFLRRASMELEGGAGWQGRAAIQTQAQRQLFSAGRPSTRGKSEGQLSELTLEKAMTLLNQEDMDLRISAAQYIQHQCFASPEARKMVFYLHGVPKLIGLLKEDDEQMQTAVAGALRNIVYESDDNKMEVKDSGGIAAALELLKKSRSIEIRKQLSGLLWNLSSNDFLKEQLSKEAPEALTKSVLIPCSGIYEGENPKDDMMAHPDIFFNATGCLRNMSSAGPEGRKIMRECDSLIDSLVHYIRGTIADYIPDDKSTENCVCILHNLTYQMEAELPEKYIIDVAEPRKGPVTKNKTPGCFGMRSTKVLEQREKAGPLLEEKSNPRGVEWLWSPITVRMYLSIMARSSRRYSKEAALGALQNVTSGNGAVSHAMACTIVKKEGGLQQVKTLLQEDEPAVKKTAVALVRNLSHFQELHGDIVKHVLPELVDMFPEPNEEDEVPAEVTVSLCNIILNVCQSESSNAKALLNQGGIKKLIAISGRDFGNAPSRESQAASVLLHTLWRHTDLHGAYKRAGYKKPAFINSRTTKAVNLVGSNPLQ
ncbi:hypothetical protein GJAV_G00156500 [Gymnothorax javanicus]|nr:hypothetical protein GJAV_G00156500 [Gymnothorax javanicus]